jgi:hypothetical protein
LVKVWLVKNANDYAEVYAPFDSCTHDDLLGAALNQTKLTIRLAWAENTLHHQKPNMPGGFGGSLIFDASAWQVTSACVVPIANVTESVFRGERFWVATPRVIYPALDEERSVGRRLKSGLWMTLTKPVLRGSDLGSAALFRVAQRGGQRTFIFCQQAFWDVILANGLTGLEFIPCEVE